MSEQISVGDVVDHPELGACGVLERTSDGRLRIAPVAGEPVLVERGARARRHRGLEAQNRVVAASSVTARTAAPEPDADMLRAWMAERHDPTGRWRAILADVEATAHARLQAQP